MSVPTLVLTTLRLAVPLYLSTLFLALLPTVVAMLGLFPLAGDRPWRGDLLAPGWMNVAVEIIMSAAYRRDASGLLPLILAFLVVGPLALLGQTIAYSLLAGGILATLHANPARRPPFWAACRHWFWPSFRLSLLGGILVIVASLLGGAIAGLTGSIPVPELPILVQFALQALVLGWLECARAWMVAYDRRSVGSALRWSGRAWGRPLIVLLWLLLALPSTALSLVAIMPPGVDDPYALGGLLLALAFGQLVAFLGAWTKVVRLAVALRVAQSVGPAPPAKTTSRASELPAAS